MLGLHRPESPAAEAEFRQEAEPAPVTVPVLGVRELVDRLMALRAMQIGSHAGLTAVPQPLHCFAVSVWGFSAVLTPRRNSRDPDSTSPIFRHVSRASPGTWAPARSSIALLTLCDFGKPEPYIQPIWSRISKPASSIATAKR
jgi:hypothetical protein